MLTTIGGEALVDVVHGFSVGDVPVADLSGAARVRDALLVLGAACFISLIGGLRAISVAKREAREEAAREAEEAAREAEEAAREEREWA